MIDTKHFIGLSDVLLQDQQDCDLLEEGNLAECTSLDLSWSQIKVLKTDKLVHLIELNVAHTLIKQLILKQLTLLQRLNISHTEIIKVDLIAQKQLVSFILDGSRLLIF